MSRYLTRNFRISLQKAPSPSPCFATPMRLKASETSVASCTIIYKYLTTSLRQYRQ